MEVKLTKLIFVDIYRDGGSYEASFETGDGPSYNVWLQRSKMPDDDGLHHRWLFEYLGKGRPQDCLLVVTGSNEERALLDRLKDFAAFHVDASIGSSERADLSRLAELVHYIERREPCLPSDLAAWRLDAE